MLSKTPWTGPQVDFQGKFEPYRRREASTVWSVPFPSMSHAARVTGFIVDPGW